MVVYGDRVESTVSDTSISITAMSEEFLMDMGIQGPDEMVNFIPATTRTDWDIKIRGIGRNFRGLGGDPGVGTYYNGIYSPDFGIASTEGGLYDIQRIDRNAPNNRIRMGSGILRRQRECPLLTG